MQGAWVVKRGKPAGKEPASISGFESGETVHAQAHALLFLSLSKICTCLILVTQYFLPIRLFLTHSFSGPSPCPSDLQPSTALTVLLHGIFIISYHVSYEIRCPIIDYFFCLCILNDCRSINVVDLCLCSLRLLLVMSSCRRLILIYMLKFR